MIDVENPTILNLIPNYEFEERWEKLLLASEIVDATFNYFQIERDLKDKGRRPWNLKNMVKLMFLASVEKNENSVKISDDAKTDIFIMLFVVESCQVIAVSETTERFTKVYIN